MAPVRILCRDNRVRLRGAELDEYERVALAWYQDPEVLRFSEGGEPPYDRARLRRMFEVLSTKGELYFIEVLADGAWRPVGDAALLPDDVPIVIGRPEDRSRGIASEAMQLLVMRARELGWTELRSGPIDAANVRSRRLFQRAGFLELPAASADDTSVFMVRTLERDPA
jgi:RimJ/RimL family protein N-acetyltransferase